MLSEDAHQVDNLMELFYFFFFSLILSTFITVELRARRKTAFEPVSNQTSQTTHTPVTTAGKYDYAII